MSIFECKALTKNYGAKTVLDSIDLTIEPGRIVGLLGPAQRRPSSRTCPTETRCPAG